MLTRQPIRPTTEIPTMRVRFLMEEADLLAGIEPRLAAHLQRTVTAPLWPITTRLPFTGGAPGPDVLGLLVLDGLLSRRLLLGGRSSIDLLGPGDLIRPWQEDDSANPLMRDVRWRALSPSRTAVIDGEVVRTLSAVPSVLASLVARIVDSNHALSERLAIAQMPVLRTRVMALLWHLADQWGRVEPGRTVIPLRLSHSALAELLAAQRPSVSVALAGLVSERHIGRGDDGFWHLLTPAEVFLVPPGNGKAGAARRRLPSVGPPAVPAQSAG
jgi:CRP/FNR family transcriptional regulator, cyclic AMP receptor protein